MEQRQDERGQEVKGDHKAPLHDLGRSQGPLFQGGQAVYDHREDEADEVETDPEQWFAPEL